MSAPAGLLQWVPECSSVPSSEATVEAAMNFDPGSASYWKDHLGSLSMLPGYILGGICVLGFAVMTIWICVRTCKNQDEEDDVDYSDADTPKTPPPPQMPNPINKRNLARRKKAADVVVGLMLLFAVATVGLAAWGMGESIKQTNSSISDFWDIVEEVNDKIQAGMHDLQQLSYSMVLLSSSIPVLSAKVKEALPQLENMGVPQELASEAVRQGEELPLVRMRTAAAAINDSAVPVLQDALQVVEDVSKYKDPTLAVQDTWRFVILAVLFGLLIVGAIGTTVLCFTMRFGRWACLAVATMWLLTSVLMLGGVGLLGEAQQISEEGCLYFEPFTYHLASTLSSDGARKLAKEVLDYYYGVTNVVPNEEGLKANKTDVPFAAALVSKLTGISTTDLTPVLYAAEDIGSELASLFDSSGQLVQQYSTIANGTYIPSVSTVPEVEQFATGMVGVLSSTTQLVNKVRRASVIPTYHELKTYICCDVQNTFYWMWISWTVAGSCCMAYCLLASTRVVWQTLFPDDCGWAYDKLSFALGGDDESLVGEKAKVRAGETSILVDTRTARSARLSPELAPPLL